MKKAIESLPSEGCEIRLTIESDIIQPIPPAPPSEPSGEVEYDTDDEFPYDIEDAAMKYLESRETGDTDGTQHLVQDTTAVFAVEDGRATVSYDDSEMLGMPKTLTQITFSFDEPDTVEIVRTGGVSSMFVISRGKRHLCEYKVGPMSLSVTFRGIKVENTVTRDGTGEICLDYVVEMGGAVTQRTRMRMVLGEH